MKWFYWCFRGNMYLGLLLAVMMICTDAPDLNGIIAVTADADASRVAMETPSFSRRFDSISSTADSLRRLSELTAA